MSFQLPSTIKVKFADEMMRSAYSCVILITCKGQKITICRGFNLISNP